MKTSTSHWTCTTSQAETSYTCEAGLVNIQANAMAMSSHMQHRPGNSHQHGPCQNMIVINHHFTRTRFSQEKQDSDRGMSAVCPSTSSFTVKATSQAAGRPTAHSSHSLLRHADALYACANVRERIKNEFITQTACIRRSYYCISVALSPSLVSRAVSTLSMRKIAKNNRKNIPAQTPNSMGRNPCGEYLQALAVARVTCYQHFISKTSMAYACFALRDKLCEKHML